jgi:hypothetical protein
LSLEDNNNAAEACYRHGQLRDRCQNISSTHEDLVGENRITFSLTFDQEGSDSLCTSDMLS